MQIFGIKELEIDSGVSNMAFVPVRASIQGILTPSPIPPPVRYIPK